MDRDPPLDFYFEKTRNTFVTTKLERHAEQLSALGHPVRLAILRFIVQRGLDGTPAGAIQSHVDVPASTLTHHLHRLESAGLVSTREEGTFVLYRPQFPALHALTDYLWQDCCKRGKATCC